MSRQKTVLQAEKRLLSADADTFLDLWYLDAHPRLRAWLGRPAAEWPHWALPEHLAMPYLAPEDGAVGALFRSELAHSPLGELFRNATPGTSQVVECFGRHLLAESHFTLATGVPALIRLVDGCSAEWHSLKRWRTRAYLTSKLAGGEAGIYVIELQSRAPFQITVDRVARPRSDSFERDAKALISRLASSELDASPQVRLV